MGHWLAPSAHSIVCTHGIILAIKVFMTNGKLIEKSLDVVYVNNVNKKHCKNWTTALVDDDANKKT